MTVNNDSANIPVADDDNVKDLIDRLVALTGSHRNRDLMREIVTGTLELSHAHASRLDLKIARSAIEEMAEAFKVFAPYRGVAKATIFGSARTAPSDNLYSLTRNVAHELAEAGWMVVTGAGPGIMAAGNEGAGPDKAIGVNIRLPFETQPNAWIADNEKLVEMKYFFTRKLMLMKESTGFVVLPGGFGTLDECFELLTLLQTGKAEPAPIVLLDLPGTPYWSGWETFVNEHVYANGLADQLDSSLYRITDDVAVAVNELLYFYSNYHSRRFVDGTMIIRLHRAPDDATLRQLSVEFADIVSEKGIWRTLPLAPELANRDHLHLERVAMEFDQMHHGRLRQLIDSLNAVPRDDPEE